MRRVAVLMRDGREIQCSCPDQDSALRWMKENWRAGDEWVAIEDEELNLLRLRIQQSQRKLFLTAADIVLLKEMRIGL